MQPAPQPLGRVDQSISPIFFPSRETVALRSPAPLKSARVTAAMIVFPWGGAVGPLPPWPPPPPQEARRKSETREASGRETFTEPSFRQSRSKTNEARDSQSMPKSKSPAP